MSFEPRRLLERPTAIRGGVVTRCAAAEAEFDAAVRQAVLAQIQKFPELVQDAESPTEVLRCMELLHSFYKRSQCAVFDGTYPGSFDAGLEAGKPFTDKFNAAVEAHVIPALEAYFVAYAAANAVKMDGEYRDLWADSYRGSVGIKLFHTSASERRFSWKRDFDDVFEDEPRKRKSARCDDPPPPPK